MKGVREGGWALFVSTVAFSNFWLSRGLKIKTEEKSLTPFCKVLENKQ